MSTFANDLSRTDAVLHSIIDALDEEEDETLSSVLEGMTITFIDINDRIRTWASEYLPENVSLEDVVKALGANVHILDETHPLDGVTHALAYPDLTEGDGLESGITMVDQHDIPVIHLYWLLVAFIHRTYPAEEHFAIDSATPLVYDSVGKDVTGYHRVKANMAYFRKQKEEERSRRSAEGDAEELEVEVEVEMQKRLEEKE